MLGTGQDGMYLSSAIQVAKETALRLDQMAYIVREGEGFQVYATDALSAKTHGPIVAAVQTTPMQRTVLLWIMRPQDIDGVLW